MYSLIAFEASVDVAIVSNNKILVTLLLFMTSNAVQNLQYKIVVYGYFKMCFSAVLYFASFLHAWLPGHFVFF